MERKGKCLCGAVTYSAKELKPGIGACHCSMCRRWAGGPLLAASAGEVSWQGEDKIQTFKSSAWAERGFCTQCGSSLFYRVTAPGPFQGSYQLAFGTLDDQSEFTIDKEWFIDKKPDAYTLAGEHKRLTEAEVFAMFGGGEG